MSAMSDTSIQVTLDPVTAEAYQTATLARKNDYSSSRFLLIRQHQYLSPKQLLIVATQRQQVPRSNYRRTCHTYHIRRPRFTCPQSISRCTYPHTTRLYRPSVVSAAAEQYVQPTRRKPGDLARQDAVYFFSAWAALCQSTGARLTPDVRRIKQAWQSRPRNLSAN